MQFFCKITTKNDKVSLIENWINDKSVKWMIKTEELENDLITIYSIFLSEYYSNSGNIKKVLNNYVFNKQTNNIDLIKITFTIN